MSDLLPRIRRLLNEVEYDRFHVPYLDFVNFVKKKLDYSTPRANEMAKAIKTYKTVVDKGMRGGQWVKKMSRPALAAGIAKDLPYISTREFIQLIKDAIKAGMIDPSKYDFNEDLDLEEWDLIEESTARERGKEAARRGKSARDNPYTDPDKREEWWNGYEEIRPHPAVHRNI